MPAHHHYNLNAEIVPKNFKDCGALGTTEENLMESQRLNVTTRLIILANLEPMMAKNVGMTTVTRSQILIILLVKNISAKLVRKHSVQSPNF